MKRILVTGATGFVGHHLLPYLLRKDVQVWASYRRKRTALPLRVHWFQANLTEPGEVFRLVHQARPDVVFHLAARTNVRTSWTNPGVSYRTNVVGSLNLFEAILKHAPRARIVVVSSAQVYGRAFAAGSPVNEKATAEPVSPYGGSKLLMELAALNYVKREKLSIVVARPINQIGRGQPRHLVFADFCHQLVEMERGRKPAILEVGDLGVVRDFVHVRDVVRALALLAVRGRPGAIYNIGSGKGVLLREGLDFLRRQARIAVRLKRVSSRYERNDIRFAVLDCARIRALGWRPRESFWGALRELLQEARERAS